MNPQNVIETVKENVAQAKNKAGMVAAHAPSVLKSGIGTLQAAREVIAGGRREAGELLTRTANDLKRTLQDGAADVSEKISRLTTPTHKEQAAARKAQIKAKKRSRQARATETETAE